MSSACLVIVKYDIACCFSKPQNSTRKEALPYIFKVFLVKRALDVKEEERVFFSHVSAWSVTPSHLCLSSHPKNMRENFSQDLLVSFPLTSALPHTRYGRVRFQRENEGNLMSFANRILQSALSPLHLAVLLLSFSLKIFNNSECVWYIEVYNYLCMYLPCEEVVRNIFVKCCKHILQVSEFSEKWVETYEHRLLFHYFASFYQISSNYFSPS